MGLGSKPNSSKNTIIQNIRTTESVLGGVIPIVIGQNRVPGHLLAYSNFRSHQAKNSVGGKGLGGSVTSYTYTADVVEMICQGPIDGIANIWDSFGRFAVLIATETFVVPVSGTYTAANSGSFNTTIGVGVETQYAVNNQDYGNPNPTVLSGTYLAPVVNVSGTPGPGQYSIGGDGVYIFAPADAGKSITIVYTYNTQYIFATEIYNVPTSPPFRITVNNANYFASGTGSANYYPGGGAVPGVAITNDGRYTFQSSDAGKKVRLSYQYSDVTALQSPTTHLSLTIHNGALGQAPPSSSSFPYTYSSMCIVDAAGMDLGSSASTPNYNYEVISPYRFGGGIHDAHVITSIFQLLTNPVWGFNFPVEYLDDWGIGNSSAWNFLAANNFFISPVLDQAKPCGQWISEWCDAAQLGTFFSEGKLKIVPYGDTSAAGNGYIYKPNTAPVVDLSYDDMVPESQNTGPIQITRVDIQDIHNRVRIEYRPRLASYNTDIVPEDDSADIAIHGLKAEDAVSYNFVCEMTSATFAAVMRLRRIINIRAGYKFSISAAKYSYLEPMDIVTVSDLNIGINKVPVRIKKIQEMPHSLLKIEAEEFPWSTSSPTIYPKQWPPQDTFPTAGLEAPGPTSVIIFEAPNRLALQEGNTLYIMASGSVSSWGGCSVWVSNDGLNYARFGEVDTPARAGKIQNNITPTDTAFQVVMENADIGLAQPSPTDVTNNTTLSVLITGTGVELITFSQANLVGPGTYDMVIAQRGMYGTQASYHNIGDVFAKLDNTALTWKYDPTYYGKTVYFKFTSFNTMHKREQLLSDVTAVSFTIPGVNQGPISISTGIYQLGYGSVAPQFSSAITYVSGSSSITWSWHIPLYRTDLNLTTLTLTGTQECDGLTAGTTYTFFPYCDDVTQSFAMVKTGGIGTIPTWAHLGDNLAWDAEQWRNDHTPLSKGPLTAATVATGTGGGSGGGSGTPAGGLEGGTISVNTQVNGISYAWSTTNVGSDNIGIFASSQSFFHDGGQEHQINSGGSGNTLLSVSGPCSINFYLVDITSNTTLSEATGNFG